MKGAIYYVAIATVIFSRVKITCYFHTWRYQVFARKLTWYVIGVYIININIIGLHVFTECLSYSEWFNICIMHSACYMHMYQGINSKFVFKIAISSASLGGSCNVTYLFSWFRQAFSSSFHAPRWPLRITMSASCSICHAQIFFWKIKKCVLLLSDYNFYLHCGYPC